MQLIYQGVSKLADSEEEKYVISAKHILKPVTIPKLKMELADETKPIDLAFIWRAPFTYFVKQKDVEIFAISIKNIEYQLKKATKIPMLMVDKKINSSAATNETIKLDDYLQNIYHKFN